MKRLSDHARALAARLYEKPSWGARLLGRCGLNLEVLQELVECVEPAAIVRIVPVLIVGDAKEVTAGARAITALLALTRPEDLVGLDEHMRGSWVFSDPHGEEWRRLDRRELARWVGPGEPGTLLLKLSTLHGNGFVREEAVRRLGLSRDGSELPYLLLRLNDWVGKVRQAARAAVAERIHVGYTEHFVYNLALVVRLQHMERADHSELLERITALLTTPAARPAMTAALHHSSGEIRRASFRMLVSAEPAGLEQVLLAALEAPDPSIRLWSLRRAADTLDKEPLLAVLDARCLDPVPTVRREALAGLAAATPETAAARLRAALFDRSPAVRAQARFHLRQQGQTDFADSYRSALATTQPKVLAAAMGGLAETGATADAERFVPYLQHARVRVRRAAIYGLMALGGDSYVPQILDRVLDAAPGVSNQARRALQSRAALVGGEELWERFSASALPHVRRNLLRLIAGVGKWGSISLLVLAAGDDDKATAALAREYIRRWNAGYNRRQTVPSADQVRRLEEALTHTGGKLPPTDLALLRFAAQSYL